MALDIPPLYCPIPGAVNPHIKDINARGLEWISQFGIFDDLAYSVWARYVDSYPGMLPARVMPHAPKGPALQAAANLLFWLWAFDDLACDEIPTGQPADDQILLLCDLARAAEGHSGAPANPFAAALRDLHRLFEAVATPTQFARWASAMHPYFLANAAIAVHQSRKTTTDLDTYVALRIHSGAVKPTLVTLDVADGYELPTAQLERPDVVALSEMVCTIVGWDNDLMTYHKETMRGGADHNLVSVLAESHGLSAAEAVAEAIAMRDRVLCLFLRLRDQVTTDASTELRRYVTGLEAWIRGHLDWGMQTARYRNPADPAARLYRYAGRPRTTDPSPLPIPTITWWWDQLGPRSATATRWRTWRTRQRTSPSASTGAGSSTSWGAGTSTPKARTSGLGHARSWPTAGCTTSSTPAATLTQEKK
jgi:hypothetical protein